MESEGAERWRGRAALAGLLMTLAGLLFVPWVFDETFPELAADLIRGYDNRFRSRPDSLLVLVQEHYIRWGSWLTGILALLATVSAFAWEGRRSTVVAGLLLVTIVWLMVAYYHLALVDQPQVGPYLPMVGGLLLVAAAWRRRTPSTRTDAPADPLP